MSPKQGKQAFKNAEVVLMEQGQKCGISVSDRKQELADRLVTFYAAPTASMLSADCCR